MKYARKSIEEKKEAIKKFCIKCIYNKKIAESININKHDKKTIFTIRENYKIYIIIIC